jgi:hypothetical protein
MKRFVTRLFPIGLGAWTSTALTCAVLLVASVNTAQAGISVWTSHGPYGGNVSALAIDPATPSTLYAGTYGGGVFQSSNSGKVWSAVNTGLSGNALFVYALAINPATPSTLYAGTWRSGVFQSTNSGGSWRAVNTGLSGNALRVSTLAIDPATPGTLYAGTDGGGVFQSTNSGATWSAVSTGLSGDALYVHALAIDPTTPSTLYAGTEVGVFSIQQVSLCVGDCNGNGQVTVDEILTMVNIALGNADVSACGAGDANEDGQITVDEILTAVNNALNGCVQNP